MTLGPVRVMGAGVVAIPHVIEVRSYIIKNIIHCYLNTLTVMCSLLANPDNGIINCSLGDDGAPSYEDACSFTCNTGYELTGSDTRTCQSNGSWSGDDVMCVG